MTLAFLALLGAPYIYDISSLRVKLGGTNPPCFNEVSSKLESKVNIIAEKAAW